jgi:hypothetical protein
LADKQNIEWAVIQPVFRGTRVIKSGLASEEEAKAWLTALQISRAKERRETFLKTDGMTIEEPYEIAWRNVDSWHSTSEA